MSDKLNRNNTSKTSRCYIISSTDINVWNTSNIREIYENASSKIKYVIFHVSYLNESSKNINAYIEFTTSIRSSGVKKIFNDAMMKCIIPIIIDKSTLIHTYKTKNLPSDEFYEYGVFVCKNKQSSKIKKHNYDYMLIGEDDNVKIRDWIK